MSRSTSSLEEGGEGDLLLLSKKEENEISSFSSKKEEKEISFSLKEEKSLKDLGCWYTGRRRRSRRIQRHQENWQMGER